MADPSKPSPVETFKIDSNYLRGDIAEELVDENDFFGKASTQLLKHHGTYQQDDRDARAAGRGDAGKVKAGKVYSFMVRTKIPGGKLTSEQLLAEFDLCDEVGNTTLRITTRQGLQLHGVLKHNLRQTIQRINDVQLSTLAACGDVERNVMCCPAPLTRSRSRADARAGRPARRASLPADDRLSRDLADRSRDGRRDAGRRRQQRPRDRADLRPDLSAAQIQDGHRPGRRQLRRPVCQRPGADGRCRRRHDRRATTCWSAAAWVSRPAPKRPFRPWPSGWRSSRPKRRSTLPRRSSRCSATSAIVRTAKWRG